MNRNEQKRHLTDPSKARKPSEFHMVCLKKEVDGKDIFDCHPLDDDLEMPYNAIGDPLVVLSSKSKSEPIGKSANTISLIILTAMIGGFGYAIAQLILYLFYDYVVVDPNDFVGRFCIALGVMLGLLLFMVLITYILFRKRQD